MNGVDAAAAAVTAIGGVNWGLVALGELDIVAALTGNKFGETNTLSRVVYGAVGAAATYQIVGLIKSARRS